MLPLDTSVFGLPLHPLIVHAVVVLLPLGALGLIACVLVRRLRERYAGLALAVTAVATASAGIAKISGEWLAEATRLPEQHAQWGDRTVLAAVLLLGFAGVWWWLGRRRRGDAGPSIGARVSGGLTGHSGAESVWQDRLQTGSTSAAAAQPGEQEAGEPEDGGQEAGEREAGERATREQEAGEPEAGEAEDQTGPAAAATPAATTPAARTLTIDEVRRHNRQDDCWAAVRGQVYDLTTWIQRHPGGPQRIINLCGTDATAAFANQHGDAQRPNDQLAAFRIGTLA